MFLDVSDSLLQRIILACRKPLIILRIMPVLSRSMTRPRPWLVIDQEENICRWSGARSQGIHIDSAWIVARRHQIPKRGAHRLISSPACLFSDTCLIPTFGINDNWPRSVRHHISLDSPHLPLVLTSSQLALNVLGLRHKLPRVFGFSSPRAYGTIDDFYDASATTLARRISSLSSLHPSTGRKLLINDLGLAGPLSAILSPPSWP